MTCRILQIFNPSRNLAFDALFFINEHGIIQQVNDASTRILGWTRDELLGQNISMVMIPDVAALHDQCIQNYLRTGRQKLTGTQRETTAQRKDKSTFPCMLSWALTEDSTLFCGFMRDMSAEKAAQAEVVESNKYMEVILDASFDALFVINDRGIIQKVNAASSKVFGWTVEEFIGQNINIIMPDEYARKHDTYMESKSSILRFDYCVINVLT